MSRQQPVNWGRLAAFLVVLAGLGWLIDGISAQHPPAPSPAQVSADRAVCVQLAGATAAAGPQDDQNTAPLDDAGTAVINDAAEGYTSPAFSRDAVNVAGNLVWPTSQQVARLQADCTALGVSGPVWPSWYHVNS